MTSVLKVFFYFDDDVNACYVGDDQSAITTVAYTQYKYPLEMVPIFEGFLLKLESLHKNEVQSIAARTGDKMNDDTCFTSSLNRQMSTILRNLSFVPSSYAALLEKTSFENNFNMEWFIWVAKHVRSFSTFTYKSYVKYREPVEEENTDKSHDIEVSFARFAGCRVDSVTFFGRSDICYGNRELSLHCCALFRL